MDEEVKKGFIFLPKTADAKLQAFGSTLEEAFSNSAYAMFSLMVEGKVREKLSNKIRAEGNDLENLLHNFLEEFLFLIDSKRFALARIKNIKIEKKSADKKEKYFLNALVLGDNIKNYDFREVVKAVTFNEMEIKKEKGKYIVQVVLDT